MLRLSTRLDALGAEFFRWEFATAVAGAVLGINPFDEPNVSEAKEKTKALLAADASGHLAGGAPAASCRQRVDVFSRASPAARRPTSSARRCRFARPARLRRVPRRTCRPRATSTQAVAEIRAGIRAHADVASTFGVGPRYLHSTGQYHKGGPNTALAFVLTADDETQTAIPEARLLVLAAEARPGARRHQTLEAHDRRTVRIHVKDRGARAGRARAAVR